MPFHGDDDDLFGEGEREQIGSSRRARGRDVGSTTGGYKGPDGDPEGSEAGGGEPDFDVVEELGVIIGQDERFDTNAPAEDGDQRTLVGDDFPDWPGHPAPPDTP